MRKSTLVDMMDLSSVRNIQKGECGDTEASFVRKTREILDGFLFHFNRIESIFDKLLGKRGYKLIITNIATSHRNASLEYGLILDHDQIIYAEKSQGSTNRFQFTLKTFSLLYNGQPTRIDALSELILKIQRVLADLESHQAIVYEHQPYKLA